MEMRFSHFEKRLNNFEGKTGKVLEEVSQTIVEQARRTESRMCQLEAKAEDGDKKMSVMEALMLQLGEGQKGLQTNIAQLTQGVYAVRDDLGRAVLKRAAEESGEAPPGKNGASGIPFSPVR